MAGPDGDPEAVQDLGDIVGVDARQVERDDATAKIRIQRPIQLDVRDLARERLECVRHELALVGGPVRDAFLGRASNDLDFATSATPDETQEILARWGDAHWDIGKEFGTIGARRFAHRSARDAAGGRGGQVARILHPIGLAAVARRTFRDVPRIIAEFEDAFGPYPQDDCTIVFTPDDPYTGIDLDALLSVAAMAQDIVGRELPSGVLRAGPRYRTIAS